MSVYFSDKSSELKQCLDSILKQDTEPDEVVIVIDGPISEKLLNTIDIFSEKLVNSRVNVNIIPLEKNVGLGAALRIGAEQCTGEYIVRMDSDDIMSTSRIDELRNYISSHPEIDIIGAQIEEFRLLPGDLGRIRRVPLEHHEIAKFSLLRNPMNHVSVCMKSRSLMQAGNYECCLNHEDYLLWRKMIFQGFRFANIDKVHVFVRVNDFSKRRSGISYLLAEFQFCKICLSRGYITRYVFLKYILSRLVVRFLPGPMLDNVYSKLRSN